jgi:hypothetical protein
MHLGSWSSGSPDNAPIYEAPGGFRLDTKKIRDAFILAKIAGIASIVATAISVYVWAIGVLVALPLLERQTSGDPESHPLDELRIRRRPDDAVELGSVVCHQADAFDGDITHHPPPVAIDQLVNDRYQSSGPADDRNLHGRRLSFNGLPQKVDGDPRTMSVDIGH